MQQDRDPLKDHPIPPLAVNQVYSVAHNDFRSRILVNEKEAVMSQETAELFDRYDHSMPSGVYTGKLWLRMQGDDQKLYLCWYGRPYHRGGREVCDVEMRPVTIFDWQAITGVA